MKGFRQKLQEIGGTIRLSGEEKKSLKEAVTAHMKDSPVPKKDWILSPWLSYEKKHLTLAFASLLFVVVASAHYLSPKETSTNIAYFEKRTIEEVMPGAQSITMMAPETARVSLKSSAPVNENGGAETTSLMAHEDMASTTTLGITNTSSSPESTTHDQIYFYITSSDSKSIDIPSEIISDTNVRDIKAASSSVEIIYSAHAKFIGVFPSSIQSKTKVQSNGSTTLQYPWYRFLYNVKDSDVKEALEQVGEEAKVWESTKLTPEQQKDLIISSYKVLKENFKEKDDSKISQ